jgi:hypothetical protein
MRTFAPTLPKIVRLSVLALLCLLVFYNLTEFPATWFDEGSHLHVPKALVRFGVYADYSSEGFRYYGPTIGLGPTVLLPIAGIFQWFGIGLFQARLVMALYLVAALVAYANLARYLGDKYFSGVAVALLVTSRGVGLLEYGRQVLGEVPGLFFVVAGLGLWFQVWEKAGWVHLIAVGGLFGLAVITKYQYLIVLGGGLLATWLLNIVYYRSAPQRIFLVPGIVSGVCFALWQVYLLLYLGPSTLADNFQSLREATAGAALVFSPALMLRALGELLSFKVYLLALVPALGYGLGLMRSKTRLGHQWGTVWFLVMVNLLWYVFASISWLRYAFLGLALASLLVARWFMDVLRPINLEALRNWRLVRAEVWRYGMLIWLVAMIGIPLIQNVRNIVSPPANAAMAMANYLNANLPRETLIETWEPEMGFLTDHRYHFPPPSFLPKAIAYIWLHQAPPAQTYDFVHTQKPPYILVGAFARWVQMYPAKVLANYQRVITIGAYELYENIP